MSSQPSTTTPSISKSAAKKRAKKAAASARSQPSVTATATAEVRVDLGDAVDPNDPSLYLPPGNYPVDLEYEHEQFYDDTEFTPGGLPPHHQSIPLPFLDYSVSPYQQQAHPFANLPPSVNITNEDLIQTANELYRRMADPKFASDDAYWSSLPSHIRNFIREAVPFAPGDAQANGTAGRDESIHSLAQRIVTVASQGMGLNNVGAGLMNGGMQSHRTAQPPPPQAGMARELGFHPHPDAREEDEFDDEDLDQETELAMAATNGDAPKKKNKKKKKKSANPDSALSPTPQPPMPPIKQAPPMQPPHPQQPASRPAFHPPPPPSSAAPNGSTPSPRAIGKQPMAANPPPSVVPARSVKGKAPATANGNSHPPAHNHPPAAKSANAKGKAPANTPPAKIWTQSSAEDRENIANFWRGLNDAERRDLVQIEKDAVVKKMKEQHRHACGCAVCGRKKVNIEMELDSLYEQYYEELLIYASDQKAAAHGRQAAPPGAGPFPGSVEVDASGQIVKFDHRAPERLPPEDDDDEGSEGYEEEEEDDYENEDDEEEVQSEDGDVVDDVDDQPPMPRQARKPPIKTAAPRPEGAEDFMAFGAGLTTIKGGILTVADDFLKNDGSKFLEMMEQLAVARSVREEQNIRDMQVETDDEDLDDKEEPISEQERAEEGKRMFMIFAARMFESRILQAYREKVAKQREEQLLRELEEEEDSKRAKEEKKAKEAQKKKDKKKQQKQRAEDEKAAREAALAEEQRIAKEKAAELERERQKKAEDERIRREAVKRAAAEEAARKDAERKKRQQEEREREEEAKRKRQEAQEKARREKEAREKEAKEKERKEKEEKAAKDKAEKERIAKEKAEKDRLAKEKAEKDRLAKLRDEEEKAKKDEAARKERAAAEQARQAAVQREREVKEQQAAAERAAQQEKAAAAAAKHAQEKARTTHPIPLRPGSSSHAPPPLPLNQPSPIKANASASASTSMHRGQSGPMLSANGQKTMAPNFHSQPLPSMSYASGSRVTSHNQNLAPGSYRPGFSSTVSPVYPPNGGPSTAPPGRFGDSGPSFGGMSTAPIGMGFPSQPKARTPASLDEFSPPHFGTRTLSTVGAHELPSQLNAMSLGDATSSHSHSAYPPHSAAPGPIGPPKAVPTPIGRPLYADANPTHPHRARSPVPEKVLGSAALGSDDDEIVQTGRRNTSNGWDIPTATTAGQGSRWSTAPTTSNIWASGLSGSAGPSNMDHLHVNSTWNTAPPPHIGAGQPGQQLRQGSFGNLGVGAFGMGSNSGPFGALNLFSTTNPNMNSHPHPQHNPHL